MHKNSEYDKLKFEKREDEDELVINYKETDEFFKKTVKIQWIR